MTKDPPRAWVSTGALRSSPAAALRRCMAGTWIGAVIAACGSTPGSVAATLASGSSGLGSSTDSSRASSTGALPSSGASSAGPVPASSAGGAAGSSSQVGAGEDGGASSGSSTAESSSADASPAPVDAAPGSSSSSSRPDAGGDAGPEPQDGGTGSKPAGPVDGGPACPSLAGPADRAYARWPIPNPPSAGLPHPFRYTDRGDGTVADDVTGLVWEKAVSAAATYVWADAQTHCAGLALAGLAWHLPTRIELLSLQDPTTGAGMAALFNPPGGKYTWTSTPWVVSQIATKPQDAWMVNFGGGGGLTSNAAAQTSAEYVRCVSGPAVTPLPYPHYAQVGPGEVEDVETGLVWAQTSYLVAVSQPAATAVCSGLALNGHAWRLPSLNELSSLVDDNPDIRKVSPAIDACVFADTPPNQYYISASSLASASGPQPWAINYADGFTSHAQTTGYVRCVR